MFCLSRKRSYEGGSCTQSTAEAADPGGGAAGVRPGFSIDRLERLFGAASTTVLLLLWPASRTFKELRQG